MNCSSQPTMVERIAQVCEKGHFKIAVQVQHLRPLPDRLLPHLFVQGWTGLPGAPLSPSTPSDQEGYCLYVIDLQMYIFRQVGPTTCPGPVQFYIVLTQYLVACWSWQTCLLFSHNKHEFSLIFDILWNNKVGNDIPVDNVIQRLQPGQVFWRKRK